MDKFFEGVASGRGKSEKVEADAVCGAILLGMALAVRVHLF